MEVSQVPLPFLFTVQQSSFYGLTSMLPFRYTQAVMTGESKHVQSHGRMTYVYFRGFAGLLASW